jgi:8-oxo-dGTP pyrophosphatase MutT (NUDIX family)
MTNIPTLEFYAPDYDALKDVPLHQGARFVGLKEGQTALLFYDQMNHYVFPGGGIEAGETALEAVIREVLEETGYHIDAVKPVVIIKEHFADSIWHHTFFTGTYGPNVQTPSWTAEEQKYTIQLGFYSFYDALDLLSTHQGDDPYSETIMNREFLGLSETINYLNIPL